MSEVKTTLPKQYEAVSDESGLVDLLIILARHKRLISTLPLGAAAIAAAISLALPNEYTGTTKLLPPQQAQSGAAALLAQFGGVAGGIAGAAASAAGLKNPNDLYIGMLKSRTIGENLIKRFDLKKVYDTDSQERALKILESHTTITSGKDGLIVIEVDDPRQEKVADIANGYVEELVSLTKVFAVTEASQRRMFYEHELETAKNNLAKAEIALKGSLDKHGVISVDVESEGRIETVAQLRAQISAKEIQRNSMQAFVTSAHPDLRRVEEELSSLRAELSRLENGKGNTADNSAKDDKQAGLENIQGLRDVKYHQMLYELLAKQYEVARLDEAKDSELIQVLDRAVKPEKKSSPKRALITILTALVAGFAAVSWAMIVEIKKRKLRSPESAARWALLMSSLRIRKS
jgi:uncharacterized protein involved in exopolysaccharide biosynthesis